jgi:thioredoxin:protein disulfide reductase
MTGHDTLTFIGIFFAGLALNLTPCVYPMLTVTVSVLSRGDKRPLLSSFFRSAVYVSGIAVMYSTLGTVAAMTGGFFGGLLQSAWVQLAIAAVMFLMALAMFGVYRFEAPAFVLEKLGHRRSGAFGLFLSGLLVGIFAAPCIGPPVAALLAHVAERRDPVYGFWLFLVMALGLGLPYLIFGTFSHALKSLPKSGVWLVWVDRFFGVVLMGFAAFYCSLALASFDLLPQRTASVPVAGEGAPKAVRWESYTPEVLQRALASGRPVVVDFYADWCLPCQEMEAVTYRHPEVIQEFERFERIKVDLTDAGHQAEMELAEAHQVYGIPTMIFFGPDGQEIRSLKSTGFIDPDQMLQLLHEASANPASEAGLAG